MFARSRELGQGRRGPIPVNRQGPFVGRKGRLFAGAVQRRSRLGGEQVRRLADGKPFQGR